MLTKQMGEEREKSEDQKREKKPQLNSNSAHFCMKKGKISRRKSLWSFCHFSYYIKIIKVHNYTIDRSSLLRTTQLAFLCPILLVHSLTML